MTKYDRNALLLAFGMAVIRFFIASGLDPMPDEAYYWLWSTKPALSYFDHPPMIAWLINLFGQFLDPVFAIRAVSCFSMGVGTWFAYLLAKDMYMPDIAFDYLVIVNLTLAVFAGSLVATPDSVMIMFGSGALYFFNRGIEHKKTHWWVLAGVFLGLALLSKYITVLIALGMLLFLLGQEQRHWLKSYKPWLALLFAIGVFSPVLWWNYNHNWASFAFQMGHGVGGGSRPWWQTFPEYLGGQAGLLNPAMFALLIIAYVWTFKLWHKVSGSVKLLFWVSFVNVGFFALIALQKKVEPNWPAFGYLPGIFLVMILAETHWGTKHWYHRLWRANWVLLVLPLMIILTHLYIPVIPLKKDPTDDFHGWKDFALQVERISNNYPNHHLAANRYQYASELALFTNKEVLCMNIDSRPNQFDWWQADMDLTGADMIFLDTRPQAKKGVVASFNQVAMVDSVNLMRDDKIIKTFWLFDAQGYKPQ